MACALFSDVHRRVFFFRRYGRRLPRLKASMFIFGAFKITAILQSLFSSVDYDDFRGHIDVLQRLRVCGLRRLRCVQDRLDFYARAFLL